MHFRNLSVWQKAKTLAVAIYKETSEGSLSRDFGLKDQMRRAAVSIPSNIAEGYARATERDRAHFLTIARGSCAELQTQVEIAFEVGLIEQTSAAKLDEQCEEVVRMIVGLRKSLGSQS